jgi:uncharacterized membrane protein YwzB
MKVLKHPSKLFIGYIHWWAKLLQPLRAEDSSKRSKAIAALLVLVILAIVLYLLTG